MNNLGLILLISHVLVCAGIVALVLLQRGKGAEAGAAFGAGASGTVFGAKGSANFLSRSTAVLATLFFVSSLALAYVGSQREPGQSVVERVAPAPDGEMPQLAPVPDAPGPGDADDLLPGLPAGDEPLAAPGLAAPEAQGEAIGTAPAPQDGAPADAGTEELPDATE